MAQSVLLVLYSRGCFYFFDFRALASRGTSWTSFQCHVDLLRGRLMHFGTRLDCEDASLESWCGSGSMENRFGIVFVFILDLIVGPKMNNLSNDFFCDFFDSEKDLFKALRVFRSANCLT